MTLKEMTEMSDLKEKLNFQRAKVASLTACNSRLQDENNGLREENQGLLAIISARNEQISNLQDQVRDLGG